MNTELKQELLNEKEILVRSIKEDLDSMTSMQFLELVGRISEINSELKNKPTLMLEI
jgi:hypothetical protein